MRVGHPLATLLAAFSAPGSAWAQCDAQRIVPSLADHFDLFGTAIALDGETLAISSIKDAEPDAPGSGVVFVYARRPSGWVEAERLLAPAGTTSSIFGVDLELSRDRLVVGSYRHTGLSGPAFVFERSPAGWTFEETLEAPRQAPEDVFGLAVALDGDTALVSRPKDSSVLFEAGSVYVYERSAAGWHRAAQLVPGDPEESARFGNTVELDGDTALVTALWDGPSQEGAVSCAWARRRAACSASRRASGRGSEPSSSAPGSPRRASPSRRRAASCPVRRGTSRRGTATSAGLAERA